MVASWAVHWDGSSAWSKAVEMAGHSVVQTDASTVDWKGLPLAASMAVQSVATKAETLAHTTVGSLADYSAGYWAPTTVLRWADTMASQTVVLMVDGSAVKTEIG
jgi:hypothetical protein